ncbi:TetR family transcriptional regulator [Tahibacter aquaticus]|uniref:TetR family transcriptional regulator n=1 Tax=Tahibacter aquaticus TaxID=520092 RepID=A0A4R6YWI4_9GAMM|nr:TetR/AcrR family transcriptional regulator [Tahibacter aquaticus]TDR43037.1 TetR family transcriptional regulator [Tahibacter aquaticus]
MPRSKAKPPLRARPAKPEPVKPAPRSNRDRTDATRLALLDAARELFVRKGYGDTSTPEVCVAAGITRGALYHHFVDKRDLFRQVLLREAQAAHAQIEAASPPGLDAPSALLAGSEAYLDAMRVAGRTRLLLLEGPAVLGLKEVLALDEAHAAASLRQGLRACAVGAGSVSIAALAPLLAAAFDRAALEIDAGADAQATRAAMLWLVRSVAGIAAPAAKPARRKH